MKFYYVEEMDGYAQADCNDKGKKEYVCSTCGYIHEIERIENHHIDFVGKKQGDFYWAAGCYIGNKKFLDMLVKYNIKGYEVHDIIIDSWHDKRGNQIEIQNSELKEIEILGRCGFLQDKEGNEIKKCVECGRFDYRVRREIIGLSVPKETWDESDIFCYRNFATVMFCTERLKEACEKEKIKNIRFIPLEEFTFA